MLAASCYGDIDALARGNENQVNGRDNDKEVNGRDNDKLIDSGGKQKYKLGKAVIGKVTKIVYSNEPPDQMKYYLDVAIEVLYVSQI